MKKIFALALVIVICLSIASCDLFGGINGGDPTPEGTTAEVTTGDVTEETTTEGEATTTALGTIVEPDDVRDPAVDDIF